ncbi:MAG: TetR/AcrR family transcriptional regulator [Pseudomonadota bacterium]|jgi:AcrR family transcriptional regulator|nr:TetR/AcrR family transcriptional regulator [Syntrophaceae bacterium]MDI9555013.1 TetR/AcrR family transcriptional regulator [Pseudomonadota bacterium]HNU85700.1 TetR/AcrR family transcriptional regulator [Syntrophales bacterium]HNZ34862.1 TetR/AcrR family transcriptional regulator [Syntrophales bacterium]HOF73869.1 TetR/AcrR family transcriptional regulator [Syntrophales bacterium]
MKNSDKRDEILRAALELIAEHGFHGAPMAMVAERAGVGAGTIYRYFEGKDALIAEIFAELEKKLVEYLLPGYSLDRPLRERFIYLSSMIIRYFMDNAIHFRFIEQYMNSPYGVTLRRERLLGEARDIDLFRNLLQEGIDRRELKDLPLAMHFALAFGPIVSLLRDHILGFLALDDALIRKVVKACWDGIRRQDGPG